MIRSSRRRRDPAAANIRIGRPTTQGHTTDGAAATVPGPRAYPDTAPERPDPALEAAARYAEADRVIDELPRKWHTLLDRSYVGGVALSGGQWQRILLGRGVYREADLIIADEPTSAPDARAEIAAFERIRALADSGRTVVLITHRLAGTRLADHIYVLDHGALFEHGTHHELLAHEGRYATMYRMQANQYETGHNGSGHTTAQPPE
ncbi:ATP-binding cassette domain-containing protein [Embleya sp. NPDC020630]|uniref:ATP-binding cassette domain-containing protein n=1 Tax=Embleya sp. NPDC020630 TaxID=3363979 RepID=UPI0037B997E1